MIAIETLANRVVMAAFPGPDLPAWMRERLAGGLGSVCLFGSNVSSAEQVAALIQAMRAVAPDVLVATDEEGGDVTRLHWREGSPHPGNAALGAVDDESLTRSVAAAIGAELATVGVDLDLAPVVDVNSNPDNPVIGVRSFGSDPDLVARHTRAYVAGLQSAGVGACVKHFPGHGETSVDSHRGLPTVGVPIDVLRSRELPPFAAAVEAGALAVMTAHLVAPALDPARPATVSPAVLGLLRTDLGFDGLVISDALDMKALSANRREPESAVLALAAGVDLVCLGADKDAGLVDAVAAEVAAAVGDGRLAEDRLAEAAERVQATSRRVREWRESAAAPAHDRTAGAQGATRALRVDGSLPPVRGAKVLRFVTGTNAAVGQVPWGLPADGAVLDGGAPLDVHEASTVDDLVAAATGRPVVALVRDAHRHPWVASLLADLAAVRPDLVSVEMGWPGTARLPGAATVLTYGASRASGEALDALLTAGAA